MDVANYWFSSSPAGGFEITNSLRFRGAQYLRRTTSASGTNETFSAWVKIGDTTQAGTILARPISAGVSELFLRHASELFERRNGSTGVQINTTQLHRDPAAWYHIVCTVTSGVGTELFVNGVSLGTVTETDPFAGAGNTMTIGAFGSLGGSLLNGYMAEVHFVSQALTPTSFGQYNTQGVWVPKEVTGVTYGTNGFYLDFSDPADIGADRSGNGNNFTPTGFELVDTADNNYDHAIDTPTDNFGDVNLNTQEGVSSSGTYFYRVHATTTSTSTWTTKHLPLTLQPGKSGKYFITSQCLTGGSEQAFSRRTGGLFIAEENDFTYTSQRFPTGGTGLIFGYSAYARYVSWAINGVVQSNITRPTAISRPNVCLAYDVDTQKAWFGWYDETIDSAVQWLAADGTYTGDPAAGTGETAIINLENPSVCLIASVQQAGTAGNTNAYQTISDPNQTAESKGIPVPTGFEVLSSTTLPNVAITNPSDHFTTILDTGANILTNAQSTFSNGLWWIKDRDNSNQHQFVDSLRGGNLAMDCPTLAPESAYSAPAGNSVAWCWATAGSPATNNNGTIQSTVDANTAAGFSMVNWTGTGATGSVGHGLSAAPEFYMVVQRNFAGLAWYVYFTVLDGSLDYMELDTNIAKLDSGIALPTSTTFSVNAGVQGTGRLMAAYCWHSVPGYSAFGSYVGNGNVDGPFIYTGFRPAFVLIKATTGTFSWVIVDSSRDTYNPTSKLLQPNDTANEEVNTAWNVDLLSNGFKLRTSNASFNNNGQMIYAAFAEHPFGGGNVSPANAR